MGELKRIKRDLKASSSPAVSGSGEVYDTTPVNKVGGYLRVPNSTASSDSSTSLTGQEAAYSPMDARPKQTPPTEGQAPTNSKGTASGYSMAPSVQSEHTADVSNSTNGTVSGYTMAPSTTQQNGNE
jgi:hypothetical protein